MTREKQKPKRHPGKRGPSKRKLASQVSCTTLWESDLQLLNEERNRLHITGAMLLRRIVHRWALERKVSAELSDGLESIVRATQEGIVSEQIAPLKESMSVIITQLAQLVSRATSAPTADNQVRDGRQPDGNESTQAILSFRKELKAELNDIWHELNKVAERVGLSAIAHGEQLNLNEALIGRLVSICTAHYMLAGQSFANSWASLSLQQRHVVEPHLRTSRLDDRDAYQASITEREEARQDGLRLVEAISKTSKWPGKFEMLLVNGPAGG